MNDRDYKKWKPFNSVVPSSYLLEKEVPIEVPLFSLDKIEEFEEKLKNSLYLKSVLNISYIDNNHIKNIKGYVIKLDPINKNIYLNDFTINFRQIIDIK